LLTFRRFRSAFLKATDCSATAKSALVIVHESTELKNVETYWKLRATD
jgi:hypothetical protein